MSSTLTVTNLTATNLTDGAGTTSTFANVNSGSAKAWVNFNGTGTPAIRGSQNISSLTDYATGTQGINFSSNMNDVNFAVSSTCQYGTGGTSLNACLRNAGVYPLTTGDAHFFTVSDYSVSATDEEVVVASIHGDLA